MFTSYLRSCFGAVVLRKTNYKRHKDIVENSHTTLAIYPLSTIRILSKLITGLFRDFDD